MKTLKVTLCVLACICMLSCKKTGKAPEEEAVSQVETTAVEVVPDERGYIVSLGDQAPGFAIEYLDGKVVQLSELKGKLVMIQFTASWCGVCRKEMPHIEKEIWQKHKDNPNFALIGIDLKEDKETTAKFAEDMKVTYPLTLDTDGSRFALFTGPKAGVTRNIIIDKEGKIVMLTRLFDEEEFNGMVKFIDNYLETNF
ncbi:TlpA family protein disulfide reductase [Parabacteroides sp. OttesenSCG-928-K15]|nr:TlpA family protein disulfide reductase [Parabacteroides sp. OttesenSCG-928-K15]